jgi:integrase
LVALCASDPVIWNALSIAIRHDICSHKMSLHVNGISRNREKPVSIKKSDFNRGNSRKCTPVSVRHHEAQTVMTAHFPKPFLGRKTLAFVRPGETPTLDDAIGLLKSDLDLPSVRRRDLISALRRIAAACDLSPSAAFADPTWLRQKIASLPATRLAQSPKTRANILSNALAALAHVGLTARRPNVARSPEWQVLWQHLGPSARIALGSFTQFCTWQRIDPEQANENTVESYREALKQSSLRKKPEEADHDLRVQWNRAVGAVPGWPQLRLAIPKRRLRIAPPDDELPASFRADLRRYLASLESPDVLAVDAGPPLASATIKHRNEQIRRFFGDLVAAGVPAREIVSLREMVNPNFAYRGLQVMLQRKGGPSGMIHGVAYTLLVIAKHHARLPEEDLQKLRTYCARLKPTRQGMTVKNRARLRQFDDPQNLNHLLLLPEALVQEAKAKALAPARAAAMVETALAIELLLMTALRIKNLATLNLDDNIQWSRSSKRGVCHIVIDGRHVKNGEDRDFELEGDTAALLKSYLDHHRPVLVRPTSRWLFARRDGAGPVHPIVLARRIALAIKKRTGLAVNVHLFRALGAKIYLDQNPGGYEVVRRALGHRHLSTTTAAYTGMEAISAAKHFDQTIRKRQGHARRTSRSSASPKVSR